MFEVALPADVLLARLEGQHEPAASLEVGRLADDPAGHAADELVARREEAVVRPAVGLVVADRLALADRHRAAVVAGASRSPSEARSTWATGSAPASAAAAASSGAGSRQPKAFGCWKITAAASCEAAARTPGSVVPPVGDLDDVHPEARRIRLHDLTNLRVERLRENDLRAARVVPRDEACVGSDVVPS